jgi:hypothetical protein
MIFGLMTFSMELTFQSNDFPSHEFRSNYFRTNFFGKTNDVVYAKKNSNKRLAASKKLLKSNQFEF